VEHVLSQHTSVPLEDGIDCYVDFTCYRIILHDAQRLVPEEQCLCPVTSNLRENQHRTDEIVERQERMQVHKGRADVSLSVTGATCDDLPVCGWGAWSRVEHDLSV